MTAAEQAKLHRQMRTFIRAAAKSANVDAFLDVNDLDFLVGELMVWLDEHDMALCGGGLRRIRSGR